MKSGKPKIDCETNLETKEFDVEKINMKYLSKRSFCLHFSSRWFSMGE